MDAMGGAFSAGLAAYMVFIRTDVDASDTGFSLTMAVGFSSGILWVSQNILHFEGIRWSDQVG